MTDPDRVRAGELATTAHALLLGTGTTLATAESLTGGLVTAALAGVPGASDVLRGGLVAYASEVKRDVLGVDRALLSSYGTVSEAVVAAMAERARRLLRADWGVATTGVAGPDRSEGKPVGTVYVAVAGPQPVVVERLALVGDRDAIRWAATCAALELLITQVSAAERPGADPGNLDL